MRIVVEVFGPLREKLGWAKKIVELEEEEATLRQVLEKLGISEVILDGDTIREGYIVLVNGVHAQFKGHGNTKLKDHDIISIFPPGGGG